MYHMVLLLILNLFYHLLHLKMLIFCLVLFTKKRPIWQIFGRGSFINCGMVLTVNKNNVCELISYNAVLNHFFWIMMCEIFSTHWLWCFGLFFLPLLNYHGKWNSNVPLYWNLFKTGAAVSLGKEHSFRHWRESGIADTLTCVGWVSWGLVCIAS